MVVVLVLVLSAVLFVWPSTDAPQKVDAIVVLGGSGPRIAKGLALARDGYASTVAVSNPDAVYCPRSSRRVTVICFIPDPETTQGEARSVAKLAGKYRWNRIIVVSGTPQTTRARIRFGRCYHGTVLFDPANPSTASEWFFNVVYEWGALAKALTFQRGC